MFHPTMLDDVGPTMLPSFEQALMYIFTERPSFTHCPNIVRIS